MQNKTNILKKRARAIEDWAEAHFVDPHGIIYSQIERATGRPLTPSFFAPTDDVHPVGASDPAGMYSYENCGMTTGAYTQAMVLQHHVTGAPSALHGARRGFEAIRHIYTLGTELEEGFFPKIYGGRFTDQTSTDQVLYAVLALDRYHAIAAPAEQKEIDRMIGRMIGFWADRDYTYHYYHVRDMQWPLARFPSLLLLAYRHTGDRRFESEYQRLLAAGVNRYPGESRLRRKRSGEQPPSDFEREQNAWVLGSTADAVTMDIMELQVLLQHDPANGWAPCWRRSVKMMWAEGAAAIAPDGNVYAQCLVDMQTGATRPLPPQSPGSCAQMTYLSGATSGWSSMIARAAIQAAPYLPAAESKAARVTAEQILHSLDIDDLSYMNEPERFAPEHRFLTRFFSGDAMANWLWAYWLGREREMWGAPSFG